MINQRQDSGIISFICSICAYEFLFFLYVPFFQSEEYLLLPHKYFSMRLMYICFLFFAMASCDVQKSQTEREQDLIPPPHINCPKEGDCTFEVIKNASLNLKTDGVGKLYPEIMEGDKLVIKYHYKKIVDKDLMDAGLSEYVYLEVDPMEQQIILKDKELQKVKMIYGKICHCSGNGYYQVKEGNLFLFNRNGNLQIRSAFKVKNIQQVISEIDENIKY